MFPLANPSSVAKAVTPAICVDVPRRAALRLAAAAAAAAVLSARHERSERDDADDADDGSLDSLFSTSSSSSPSSKIQKTTTIRPTVAKTADDAAATDALPGSAARSKNAGSGGGGDWSSPGLASRPEDDAGSSAASFVAADGTRVQELAPGDAGAKGARAARGGDRLLIDYVLRRSNGYFIYSTVEGVSFQPADVPVGPIEVVLGTGDLVPGLDSALAGALPGSKRRAFVPPSAGYTSKAKKGVKVLGPQPPTFASRRQLANHEREPLVFEVQVLRVSAGKK